MSNDVQLHHEHANINGPLGASDEGDSEGGSNALTVSGAVHMGQL
jgi:hypothetical protein